MAVREIQGIDTLESGFRAKYNETVQEIIISGSVDGTAKITLLKQGGGTITINLSDVIYTKGQIDQITNVGIASEVDLGITRIATDAEVNEGSEGFAYVTPATLSGYVGGTKQKFTVADTDPSNATGADGDIFLNRDSGDLFQKESGLYVLRGNVFERIDQDLLAINQDILSIEQAIELLENRQNETVIATLGTLNNLSIPTSFGRFTGQGQVILTGVEIAGEEGKSLLIRNETGQELTVIHEGGGSLAANRFYISDNEDALPLGLGCAAWFMYSLSLQRWQLVDTWGNGYSPHLVGTGQRTVVANADGSTGTEDTFLFEENRDDILVFPSKATLDGLYPDAPEGFRVYCKNISGGGAVFRKHDEVTGAWGYQMYTELS